MDKTNRIYKLFRASCKEALLTLTEKLYTTKKSNQNGNVFQMDQSGT